MEITLKTVQEISLFLQKGVLIFEDTDRLEDVGIVTSLDMTEDQAFAIIFQLQEHWKLIPAHFELCSDCKVIYDAHTEGVYVDEDKVYPNSEGGWQFYRHDAGKHFCDSCAERLAIPREEK